jgi:hypothetical protein
MRRLARCEYGIFARPMFVLRSKGTNRGQAIRKRPRVNKPCMPRTWNYFFANSITWFSPSFASYTTTFTIGWPVLIAIAAFSAAS